MIKDTSREFVTVIMPPKPITTKDVIKAMNASGLFEYQILEVLRQLNPY